MSRLRILKDTISYSTSGLVAQAVSLIAGFWVARLLGPRDFGIWNAVSLVIVYGAYADFGILSAMGRDLPYHYGRSETDRASSLESAARWATVAGAVLVSAAVAVIAVSGLLSHRPAMLATGLEFMAVALVLQQAYTYHRTALRARNQFNELSRQQVVLAVLNGALAILGVVSWRLTGRLIAAVAAQALILAYAIGRDPWRRLPRVDRRTMFLLVRIGLPITLSGAILSVVTTVDRPMILLFLGEKQLGYFGLALLLTSIISLVPSLANQVLYPRITYRFGQSGRDVQALKAFVLGPPVILASLLPFVIGPVYLVLPIVIGRYLPEFASAETATRIVVVGIFFYCTIGLTDYFLVTIGKLKEYALLGAVALGLNLVFDYIALRGGYGIVGIAIAGTPLTYLVYSTMIICYALSHYTNIVREWLVYLLRVWSPFVYMLVMLWLVSRGSRVLPPNLDRGVITVLLQLMVYTVGILPLLWVAGRNLGLTWSATPMSLFHSGMSTDDRGGRE